MIRESVSSDEVINSVEEVERLVDRVSKLEAIINANKGLFKTPVKKTGWVARYSDGMTSRWVRETEETIRDAHPGALSYHEITWED
jgi:hypothetical protein